MTRGSFNKRLCKRSDINVPFTKHVRRTLATQQQSEGGFAHYNPYNVTLKTANSVDYNWNGGFPVQSYATAEEGLDATAQILLQHNFAPVLHALRANYPARRTIKIIGRSPWGTSQSLMTAVLAGIARIPAVLRQLERTEVAG